MSNSSAISVNLVVAEGAYCGLNNGSFFAAVQDGTGPYTYDWYRSVAGSWVPECMNCTDALYNLYEFTFYKVVVTDALFATAEAVEEMPGFVATMLDGPWHYPYLANTSPAVRYVIYGEGVGQPVEHASSVSPSTGTGGFLNVPAFTYTYTATLPIGANSCMISAWAVAPSGAVSCPPQVTVLPIGPPTVLPALDALQVVPSCSNGASGRIDFSLTNGVIPAMLHVHLKNSGGTVLNGTAFTGQSMPTATGTFTNVAAGTYRLVVTGLNPGDPVNLGIPGFTYTCRDSITVVVPSTGVSCGQVQGSVFIDGNLNCTKQTNEPAVPGVVLKVLPGPYYVSTNSAGSYSLQLPAGNYTINEEHAQVAQNCSAVPIPFTVPAVVTPVNLNVPCTSLVAMDAEIHLGTGPARPGFPMVHGVTVRNLSPNSTGNITITVELDPLLSFSSAVPAPTSVVGNTLVWQQAALDPFAARNITITAQVPADPGLIGTSLTTSATLATAVTDGSTANNQATSVTTITGSYDPNDKLAITSSGSRTHYHPAQDDWIDYTLRFQNTGTDTAFTVVVTDTLPADLDPSTLVIGAGSHAFTWSITGAGTLRFQFLNIKLPHSAVNEPGSHGFVSFRIRPAEPFPPGTMVSNTANIFFDFNPPIITPPCVLNAPTTLVRVRPKVLLGGVEGAGSGSMEDALRALALIPLHEPYTAQGYMHVNGGGGGSVHASVFTSTGPDAIVDWMVVELRSATDPAQRVATRSALLQRDGDVVDTDGISPVVFAVPAGNYRVALRHRNHLGVMTATALGLSVGTATPIDFTQPAAATWGVDAQRNVGGRMVLWPGDVDFNGVVRYTGEDNDRDTILQAIGGVVPTATLPGAYGQQDVNLDGVIKYTGEDNDRDPILTTVGGTTPTAVRVEQLP